jgi:N-acetylglucosamine kinase-like BadF-type ATPase
MSILIGADAGGTKTAVVVTDGTRELARAAGAGGAVRAGRAMQAASRITAAIRRALTDAGLLHGDVLVVGAAGVGREPERGELREILRGERLAERVIVTGDLDIALEAAFGEGPGMVLVSGTGSVAVARTPDGALHRAGGLGWQMGDEGSGYAMARAALVAVGRARDGRGPATALTERLRSPAAPDLDGLVRWSSSAEPGEIAALAPLVLAEAQAGDPVAAAIVDTAAEELAAHVRALTGHFPGAGRIPVALAGGNLEPGRPLRDPVLTRLAAVSRISVLEGPLDAAMGAIALARRAAG